MKTLHIACVAGARPNFIKIAPIWDELRRRPEFQGTLIHTGQHFSPEMSAAFFEELDIPEPDVNLGAGCGSPTEQTAQIMQRLEPVLEQCRPDLTLVVGDVNSTLAAALVAAKLGIAIAHVEAGLRSFDRRMPEEINRVVTDVLSDYLFITERSAERNLLAEGIPRKKIFFVGNVMIDTLLRFRDRAAGSDVRERLQLSANSYAVATLHRPSNVDDPARLAELVGVLRRLAVRLPIVFPVHPRTRNVLQVAGICCDGIILTPPMGYLDFLNLMTGARLVCTDSGGIQEETTILGVACLTLRENTERPITIEQGTNRLAGVDSGRILGAAWEALDGAPPEARTPELWDGQASRRILDILRRHPETYGKR
jgi:UDP-N-acetylglucosamine 2-epimerase (non-hydrolysing)